MIKIKDSNGKLMFVVPDEATEPIKVDKEISYEDIMKFIKSNAKTEKEAK